jgi:hypothetical protein
MLDIQKNNLIITNKKITGKAMIRRNSEARWEGPYEQLKKMFEGI